MAVMGYIRWRKLYHAQTVLTLRTNLDVSDGDEVEQGAVFGTIESVKTLSDLYAPVSGTVTRVNPDLEDAPELINDDPWRKGWMLAITPNNTSELDGLMDSASYGEFLEDSDH
jgi:glycine cleavage system H protein